MKKSYLGIIATAMVVVLMLTASIVNAATISANKSTVKGETMAIGETVVVTVSPSVPVNAAEFILKFDKDVFDLERVESEIGSKHTVVGDTVKVALFNAEATTSAIKLTFKAKAIKEAVPFEIVDGSTVFGTNSGKLENETFENSKVNVTVAKPTPTQEPTKPANPTQQPTPTSEPTKPANPTKEPTPTSEPTKPANPTQEPTKEPTPTSEPTKPVDSTQEPTKGPTPTKPANSDSGYYDEDGNPINRLPQAGSIVPSIIFVIVLIGIVSTLIVLNLRKQKMINK